MLSIRKCYILILQRNFSTNDILYKAQNGRFMQKVLKETKSKKKWRSAEAFSAPNIPVASNLAQGATEGKRSPNSKRVAILNKLFMRYITDIMATGTSSSIFLGRGLEINRVMVTPDFNGVNVFWIAKGTEDDDLVESVLSQNAGALRHELSQLRVMGVVPKINFVKDRAYAKQIEVDLRLSKADFGEDYLPVEPSYKFKSELYLNTSLSTNVKEQIEDIEDNIDDKEEYEELPPMAMDIFGINHAEIMSKVQKSMKKSQASHRKTNEKLESNLSSTVNDDPIEYNSNKQQKEAFAQFLLNRQILQAKAKKIKEKYCPEYEYLRTEKIKYNNDLPFFEELKDDYDYLEEPEDNKINVNEPPT